MDTEVQLGEIQTDSAGRLVFLGGFGHSVTPSSSNPITNFSNNDGWHDDVSDGPVTAQVTVDGVTMEAEAAWVAVAPPNYAPGITPVVTLYELCLDAVGTKLYPDRPSFADDIYPLLQRLSAMQWVNSGQDFYHGWKANLDLLDEEFLSTLADTSPGGAKAQFFDELRNPDFLVDEPDKIPVLMGDGIDYPGSPRRWFAFLAQQYDAMRRWKDGEFDNDTGLYPPLPVPLEQIPPDEQPAALDRAAIEPCLGGPFHPGIELTWPLRQASMWRAPLRLNHRDVQGRTGLTEDYGLLLSPEKCLDPVDGPLTESGPGDLTRWMGCPWQSDAASCQNIYVPKDFPLPAWWPAILPIDVLPDFGYQQIMAADLLQQQRQKFFGFRRGWSRGIGDVGYHAAGGYAEAMIHMVNDWHKLGFVVAQPAPDDPEAPDVPNPIYVETERQEFEA